MRRLFSLLMALILLLSPALSNADAFDDYVKERYRVRKVVGGAVIVAREGQLLYSMAYGYKNAGKTNPVTLDTCFRIASVTKLVTAVGLM